MADEPQRFVLGIAYQAGPDPRITKGADGGRDFFTKEELEKAAWSFMRNGPRMNAFHVEGTEDCAQPVESFIWRWDDWDAGDGIVVKDGDWLLGSILSPRMWSAHKAGKVSGYSPEGTARRRRVAKEGAVPIAKGSAGLADDDDELTELVGADMTKVALVGHGANGIPRFLISKEDGAAGLLEPEFVRDLIAKAEPEPSGRERVEMPNGIAISGSPADIAAFIHKAAERAAGSSPDDVAKAKNDTADRKHKAATGAAMPNGSYPIANEADLDKAIHAVGRGGSSHDAIRRHIISRARSLGASSKIPDNWNSDGSLKSGVSKEAAVADVSKADMGPELDDGIDGLDPTVPLAAPEDDAPGDPTDPGSPAWEAIDAATAQKWCSILSRARVAVDLLSEREMLEAASADPDDAENAWDLQDVCCAIDYAISVLAPFAVAEQSEADCGEQDMAAMVGKSAPDPDTWTAIAKAAGSPDLAAAVAKAEGYAWIGKSGRVLSSVNESHIREAAARLNTVLSSLPQAPATDDGQAVAKMTPAEEADMPETAPSEKVTAESGQAPAMGVQEQPPAAQHAVVTKTAGTPDEASAVVKAGAGLPVGVFGHGRQFLGLAPAAAILTDIAKADGDGKKAMCVVYNQDGALIGIVDPDDITPVANSEAKPDEAPAPDAPEPAPADAGDMTPMPAADAGTPAGDVAKATQDPAPEGAQDDGNHAVLKSALKEVLAELLSAQAPAEDVAKQADVAGLRERLEEMAGRLETVEKQPAMPGVFTHGATPPAGAVPPPRPSLRGQDQGAPQPVDVAKAMELKREMYTADPARASQIAAELQQQAIDAVAAVHAQRH